MEIGSLYYDLNIDDKSLRSQLDSADKAVKGFGDHIGQYWDGATHASKIFLGAVTAVGAGVVAFGVKSVKAFEDSQDRIAQTNAVLKSTGQIAGVTADAVTKLATSLEKQTKFSDEDVRSVENLLLTFTSIGKDIFPQATKTVLDMATALGEDTKSASIQLGKALQDPILGVTALRRVGVNFNASQQEVIANLVNTGRSAEAQRLIMAELTKEFGGSAAAAGGTFSGQLERMKNQFNNLQEAVGQFLIQASAPLVSALSGWIDKITQAGGLMAYLKNLFDQNKGTIEFMAGAIIGALIPAVISLTVAFAGLLLELAPFMIIGGALFYLWENNRLLFWLLVGALTALGIVIATVLLPPLIATAVAAVIAAAPLIALGIVVAILGAAIAGLAYLVITHFTTIKNFIIGAISAVIGWFEALHGRIVNAVAGIGSAIIAPFKTAFDWIMGRVDDVIGAINRVKNAAGSVISAPGNLVGGLLSHIPGFAEGGTVPGPIGAPQLAVVHGGEQVIPNGGSGGNNFYIGEIHNEQDENYVLRRLDRNSQLESMGISPVVGG